MLGACTSAIQVGTTLHGEQAGESGAWGHCSPSGYGLGHGLLGKGDGVGSTTNALGRLVKKGLGDDRPVWVSLGGLTLVIGIPRSVEPVICPGMIPALTSVGQATGDGAGDATSGEGDA